MNKWIKSFLYFLVFFFALGLLAPVYDSGPGGISSYSDPWHWIISFVCASVIEGIFLYFSVINRRTFYFCCNVLLFSIVFSFSFLAFFVFLLIISLTIESTILIAALSFLGVLILLLIIYVFGYRGVAVYSNGIVRIFRFQVITYAAAQIDHVQFEYQGSKCFVHIVVCGVDHIFKLSRISAKMCEQRLSVFC